MSRRHFGLVFAVTVALSLFVGCGEKTQEQRRTEFIQEEVREVKNYLAYFKDEQTGICFAVSGFDSVYSGPALATVPCEKVPEELLVQ